MALLLNQANDRIDKMRKLIPTQLTGKTSQTSPVVPYVVVPHIIPLITTPSSALLKTLDPFGFNRIITFME